MRSVKGPIDDRDPEEDKKTEIFDPTIDPPEPAKLPTPSPKSRPQLPLTPPAGSPPQPPPQPRAKSPTSKGRGEAPGAPPANVQRARTSSRATLPPALPQAPRSSPAVPVDTPPQGVPIIQATSMKAPEDAIIAKPRAPQRPQIPQVKLRSIGSITGDSGPIVTPKGRLAPPQDEREARRQRLWSNTFWASIAVIIASLVALAIWLIAGKK